MKEHVMSFLTSMFKTEKPVIGMLHLRPLPGDPLYYPGGSVSQVVEAAKRDLEALQRGGVDGILITNELSMPYEQHVSPSTLASMGYVIVNCVPNLGLLLLEANTRTLSIAVSETPPG